MTRLQNETMDGQSPAGAARRGGTSGGRGRARLARRVAAIAGCAAVATLIGGCVSFSASVAAPSLPGSERSAKPGINEPYRDAEVKQFVDRFETESREVFAQRAQIVQDLRLKRGSAVADVGAGTGAFTFLLAEAVGPAGRVFAVDITPGFIERIRDLCAERKASNVTPVLCREDSVDLPAGSIDAAFLCDVYHHFEYPRSSLASLHSALRPGGSLFVIDFHRIPGESSAWILDHVRAGEEDFTREVEAAGFERLNWRPATANLKENYFIQFRRK